MNIDIHAFLLIPYGEDRHECQRKKLAFIVQFMIEHERFKKKKQTSLSRLFPSEIGLETIYKTNKMIIDRKFFVININKWNFQFFYPSPTTMWVK